MANGCTVEVQDGGGSVKELEPFCEVVVKRWSLAESAPAKVRENQFPVHTTVE
jgi:hypothetical protein